MLRGNRGTAVDAFNFVFSLYGLVLGFTLIEVLSGLVRTIKARHPEIPIIGFPRAAGSQLARYAAGTGVNAVGVDHMTDLVAVSDAMPKGVAVQGNLDPVLLLTGGTAMEHETQRMLRAMTGRPFIFNLGHGVMQPTPPDNVARLVELVRRGG